MGHRAGIKAVQAVVKAARELGVKVLTLYAFSTENWKRPPKEVQTLMSLLKTYLENELVSMLKNDVSLRAIGQIEKLPPKVRKVLDKVIVQTAGNQGLVLNLALSYGGRSEIVMAVKRIARKCRDQELDVEEINEEVFASNLYTAGLPDPDLLIRTGGEFRLSNFLLWQSSYAELYITEIRWPDFDKAQLIKAFIDYQNRQRRFGKTAEQVAGSS